MSTEINENIIASTARSFLHGDLKSDPVQFNTLWNNLPPEEKKIYTDKAILWLNELKRVSPMTYEFIENNFAEVPYR